MGRRELVPFLEDLRGKFSKIVFSKNLAGPYFRKYVVPTNPKTDAQITMRNILRAASLDWETLTNDQRGFWSNYLNIFKSWYLGSSERVSPFNAFVSVASQIKTGIATAEQTSVINSADWDIVVPEYNKSVQPSGKPAISLKNIGSYNWIIGFEVQSGITFIEITINLTDNNMQLNDTLQNTENRDISFVAWISNPGKYPQSNMKPMVMKVLHSGKLKIKKAGNQVNVIRLKTPINAGYYKLAPRQGEYVLCTFGIQAIDGPFTILEQNIHQVE